MKKWHKPMMKRIPIPKLRARMYVATMRRFIKEQIGKEKE